MHTKNFNQFPNALKSLIKCPSDPGNLTRCMQNITDSARQLLCADLAIMFAVNPITGQFLNRRIISGNITEENKNLINVPREKGVSLKILTDFFLFVEDIQAQPNFKTELLQLEKITSFIGIALKSERYKKPLAIIYLNFRNRRKIQQRERSLLDDYIYQATLVLQNTWFFRRYSEIEKIGQILNQDISNITMLVKKIQTRLHAILDTRSGFLLAILNRQKKKLDLHGIENNKYLFFPNTDFDGACAWVIENQDELRINNLSYDKNKQTIIPLQIPNTNQKEESLIFLPIFLNNVPLGALSIQNPEPNTYSKEDLILLRLLRNHIAMAISNIEAFNNLKHISRTGIYFTKRLYDDRILENVVEKINTITGADISILYTYNEKTNSFILPPQTSGKFCNISFHQPHYSPKNSPSTLALSLKKPKFVKNAELLIKKLEGNEKNNNGSFVKREKIKSVAVVPIEFSNEKIGVLFLNYRNKQRFEKQQTILIDGLITHVAIAIKNSRDFKRLSDTREYELEILNNIEEKISRETDLTKLLETMIEYAMRYLQADNGSILIYNKNLDSLETMAAKGAYSKKSLSQKINMKSSEKSIAKWAFLNSEAVLVEDLQNSKTWSDMHLSVWKRTLCELDVPIIGESGTSVGVFNFESDTAKAFTKKHKEFIRVLSAHAIIAIKNAQEFERKNRLIKEQKILREINKKIAQSLNVDEVIDLILANAMELINSTIGELRIIDENTGDMIVKETKVPKDVSFQRKWQTIKKGKGIMGRCIEQKKGIIVEDTTIDPGYIPYFENMRSEIAVPLIDGDKPIGVINLESPTPKQFNESHCTLLTTFADQTVIAIKNAYHHQKAERQSKRFKSVYEASKALSMVTDLSDFDMACEIIISIAQKYINSQIVFKPVDINGSVDYLPQIKFKSAIRNAYKKLSDSNSSFFENAKERIQDLRYAKDFPIEFEKIRYGNLTIHHSDSSWKVKKNDELFFRNLSDQLAITIHRVIVSEENLVIEQRISSAEILSNIARNSFELSHRIGNKLGIVPSFVNNLKLAIQQSNDKDCLKYLDKIIENVGVITSFNTKITSEMSNYRFDKRPQKVKEKIHLYEIIKEVVDECNKPSNLDISINFPTDLKQILGDKEQLRPIIYNIISNAIEVLPKENPRIKISASNQTHYIHTIFNDNGPGISNEIRNEVFNLCFSTKASTGWGLYSSQINAHLNGGYIKILDNNNMTGANILLALPICI